MADSTIGQDAQLIGPFQWTEGDPVSLAWRVDVDWSGTYQSQIRKTRKPTALLIGTFTVTATWDPVAGLAGETLFEMEMSEIASADVKVGRYVCDVQEVGGVTRVWGKVVVKPQVTVTV